MKFIIVKYKARKSYVSKYTSEQDSLLFQHYYE